MSDSFAYILTTEELLLKGMIAKALASLVGSRSAKSVVRHGKRISMLPRLIRAKAERQIEAFIPQNFLNPAEYTEPDLA